ncbi:peptidase domain-containing ABC transporter [Sphingobacterium siyangense]|uniref:peptidase domain-containing ABC transporter n=2 Tax=Bacteroidota TaxID=976 RepID=UPI00289A59FB|nr:ABC transporter transmembrane domain-containing protein [Sphingobacterium siyangense]
MWFYKNIEKDIPYLSINLTLGIIISLISITTAIFSQKLIDHLLPERSYNQIVVGLILLFLILTSRSLISYLRQYVMLQQSQAYNKRLTGFFLDKIIKLPKLFFNSRKKGDLIGRLNDTQRIQQNISHIIGNFVIDTLVIIVSLAAVFIYSVLVGIIVTTIIPAIIYLVYTYTNKFVKAQKKVMNSYSQLESYYINILSGISAIKENGAQSFFIDMGKENFAIYQSAIFTLGTLTNRLTLKVDFISAIMSVGIIAICTNLFFKDQLSIGALIAIISLVSSILPSIIRIAQINVNIQEIKVAFERIFDLTNTKEETLDEESQDKIAFKSFRMENVCFRFNGRPILYDKMKLEINKGELIGIIGESGMGKSTLTEIIQGFYTPYEGNFYINDKLYSSLQLSSWRKCYATVPQEIKIFNGNIYFNIVLNRPCTEKEFQKFCNNYGFDILFQKWSINYLTLIGEEGQKLSGGQKQILGLARALYKNPQLLLLDESTSALDKYTESFILKLLKRLKMENNMAILFITHKNFITEIANRTYKLENKTLSIIEDLNSIESQ